MTGKVLTVHYNYSCHVRLARYLYQTGHSMSSVHWVLRIACEKDNVEACFILGTFLMSGQNGGTLDYQQAAIHLRFAADHGHIGACINLGVLYENGDGVVHDDIEAARLYNVAATVGHPIAQMNLAVMYRDGQLGGAPNYLKAAIYFHLAAVQGYAPALFDLAVMHLDGLGCIKSYDTAFQMLLRIVENEQNDCANSNLLFVLGCMIEDDKDPEDVEPDYVQAAKFFHRAVSQGHEDACYRLGNMYYYGRGVVQNYDTSILFYNAFTQTSPCIYSARQTVKCPEHTIVHCKI